MKLCCIFCCSVLAQMNSKEAVTRDEACEAIANLAAQCSYTEVVEKIVRHMFGVLNGR